MNQFFKYLIQTIAVGISLILFFWLVFTLYTTYIQEDTNYSILHYILLTVCLFVLSGTFIPGIKLLSYAGFIFLFGLYWMFPAIHTPILNENSFEYCINRNGRWDFNANKCSFDCPTWSGETGCVILSQDNKVE